MPLRRPTLQVGGRGVALAGSVGVGQTVTDTMNNPVKKSQRPWDHQQARPLAAQDEIAGIKGTPPLSCDAPRRHSIRNGDPTAMTQATLAPANSAPAVARRGGLNSSIKVEPLTCAIGAELINVNLGDASRDDDLFAEIKSAAAQAQGAVPARPGHHPRRARRLRRRFGALEDHPVVGSDPEHPGLVRIYKGLGQRAPSSTRTPSTATRPGASARRSGAVLRCIEAPGVGGDTIWVNMARPTSACPSTSRRRSRACAPGTASRRPSARPCRSRSASR